MGKMNIDKDLQKRYKSCKRHSDSIYYKCCVHEAGHILALIILQKLGLININDSTKAFVIATKEIEEKLKGEHDFFGGRAMNNYNIPKDLESHKASILAVAVLGGIVYANEFYSRTLGEYKYQTLEYMSVRFGGSSDLEDLEKLRLSRIRKWFIVTAMKFLYRNKDFQEIHKRLTRTLLLSGHLDGRQIKNLCKK